MWRSKNFTDSRFIEELEGELQELGEDIEPLLAFYAKMKKKEKSRKKRKKRKHLGISMDIFIYHPRKSITVKEMDEFGDAVIEMVEKKGWFAGGGWHLVDMDSESDSYVYFTPKHIKKFDLGD